MSEYLDYENGVADVLAFLVGDAAHVNRNVRLPGRLSETERQIDVIVRGRMFGLTDTKIVVDCKRWRTKVDVADVGGFVDLVEDVGAEVGLLISTEGATEAARTRAQSARGLRVELMTLAQLRAWQPPGTVSTSFRISRAHEADGVRALRRAGFRVAPDPGMASSDGEVVLDAFRHYGINRPPGEQQSQHLERATETLAQAGVPASVAATGVTIGGGTPAHRWLDVTSGEGCPIGLKILAASDTDVDRELDRLAADFRVPRQALSVAAPTTGLCTACSV